MPLPAEETIRETLKKVQDPELHIDVVNLGLIYKIDRKEETGDVKVQMGLTSPACPYGPEIQRQVYETVSQMEGVQTTQVDITLYPPWDPRTMASDEAKDILGIF